MVEGIADALLVSSLPVGELVAARPGEGDHCDAPVAGVRCPRSEPGLEEDLNQPADSVWRESQHVRELADPDRLVIVKGQQ